MRLPMPAAGMIPHILSSLPHARGRFRLAGVRSRRFHKVNESPRANLSRVAIEYALPRSGCNRLDICAILPERRNRISRGTCDQNLFAGTEERIEARPPI